MMKNGFVLEFAYAMRIEQANGLARQCQGRDSNHELQASLGSPS